MRWFPRTKEQRPPFTDADFTERAKDEIAREVRHFMLGHTFEFRFNGQECEVDLHDCDFTITHIEIEWDR